MPSDSSGPSGSDSGSVSVSASDSGSQPSMSASVSGSGGSSDFSASSGASDSGSGSGSLSSSGHDSCLDCDRALGVETSAHITLDGQCDLDGAMTSTVHAGTAPVGCVWDGYYERNNDFGGIDDVLVTVMCRHGAWHVSVGGMIIGLMGSGSSIANLTVDADGHLIGTANVVVDYWANPPDGEAFIAWSCNATITFGPP
jgi:hypothetical protein